MSGKWTQRIELAAVHKVTMDVNLPLEASVFSVS